MVKHRLLILLSAIAYVSLGQAIPAYKTTDFPKEKFVTKEDRQTLGDITVSIVQVRPIKEADSMIPCRTWMTIKSGNTVIKELSQDMEALGGCSGYYFPDRQPNKDLIVISKFGDYDGRLLIVNKKGELNSYIGGKFYLSPDTKYLFSNYDSDLSGVTIVDLDKNDVLFSAELDQYLADWYYEDGKFYAVVSEDVVINGQTKHLVFDVTTMKFTKRTVTGKPDPIEKLAVFNDPLAYADCHCGK